jgi:hypothetical protein
MKEPGQSKPVVRLLRVLLIALLGASLGTACRKATPKEGNAGGSSVTVSDAEGAGLAGQWKGIMKTKNHHEGTMELSLIHEGAQLKAAARFYNDKVSSASPIKGLDVKDTMISFTTNILGANVHFTGKLNGDKLSGTLEAVQRGTTVDTGDWDLSRPAGKS